LSLQARASIIINREARASIIINCKASRLEPLLLVLIIINGYCEARASTIITILIEARASIIIKIDFTKKARDSIIINCKASRLEPLLLVLIIIIGYCEARASTTIIILIEARASIIIKIDFTKNARRLKKNLKLTIT